MNKTRKILIVLVMGLALSLVAAACGSGGEAKPSPTNAPPPPPKPTETAAPTATPAPDLSVSRVRGYRDDLNSLYVVGLVTNNTTDVLENIRLNVKVLDADGATLTTGTAFADAYTLYPGETVTFTWWPTDDNYPDAANYEVSVSDYTRSEENKAEGVRAVNTSIRANEAESAFCVTGEIVNEGETPAEIQEISGAFFDPDGNLLATGNYAIFISVLAPGESTPFRLEFYAPLGLTEDMIDEDTLYLDAIEIEDSLPSWEMTYSETINDYFDQWETYHLVGEIGNINNTVPLQIRLIAGAYDADGNVLDAAEVDIPLPALAPGETVPFDANFWCPLNFIEGIGEQIDDYVIQWDPGATFIAASEYTDITVQDEDISIEGEEASVSGTILNDSGGDIESAIIFAEVRDKESGEILATGYTVLFDPLAEDDTAPYQFLIELPTDFDEEAAQFTVEAKGELP